MALISTEIKFELVRGLRKGVAKWGYAIVCWYENCLLWTNKIPGVYNEDISGGEEEYSALYPPHCSTLSPLSSGYSNHAFSVIRFVLGPVTLNAFNWHMFTVHRATISVMGFRLVYILPNLPCNWCLFRPAVYVSEHMLLCILGAVA